MNTSPVSMAHSLYTLYETLPEDVQKSFLQELIEKKFSEIEALAQIGTRQTTSQNNVILGVMEDTFTVPDDFDMSLSEALLNDFYSNEL